MKSTKWLFTISGIVAVIYGIGDFFFTELFFSLYDAKTDATGMDLGRFLGMTNITLGFVIFALRDLKDRAIARKVCAGAAVGMSMGVFITIKAVVKTELNQLGWGIVLTYLILAAWSGYLAIVNPRRS